MQPHQKPGLWKRFTSWHSRLSVRGKAIFWSIIAAVLILALIENAVAQNAVKSARVNTPAATVASAPTRPLPTATPLPTPSPTPVLTPTQKIASLIHSNATDVSKIDIEQNDGKTVVVQLTLNSASGDNATYRQWIQRNCYAVEKALWTANVSSLQDVDIAFRGVDFPGPIGVCDLGRKSTAGVLWNDLSPDDAWAIYDQAMYYAVISG